MPHPSPARVALLAFSFNPGLKPDVCPDGQARKLLGLYRSGLKT